MKEFSLYRSDEQQNRHNIFYRHAITVKDLSDLKAVAEWDHTGFKHKNSQRNNKNFESTNVFIADIDNSNVSQSSYLDAEKIIELFKDLKFYLIPSKNHNIDKAVTKSVLALDTNGNKIIDEKGKPKREKKTIIEPARPKYHLYFPLSKQFDDYDEIRLLYKNVLDDNPFLDGSLKDPGRYIDSNYTNPNKDDCYVNDGKWFIDDKWDYEVKPKEASKWSKPENYVGIAQGTEGRNNVLLSKAGHLLAKKWTQDMIKAYLTELNKTYQPPVEDEELRRIIEFVATGVDDDGQAAYEYMLEHYSYITLGGQSYVMEDGNLSKIKLIGTARNEFAGVKLYDFNKKNFVDAFDKWKESPDIKRYTDTVFDDKWDGDVSPIGFRKYNQWKGWRVKPDKSKSCDLFYDLLYRIICNENDNEYNYLLNWFAHIIQNPTEKLYHQSCIALKGTKGVGKGTVAKCIKELFHPDNFLETAKREDLFSRFNGSLLGKVFVFGDEVDWPGDKVSDGIFKDLITNDNLRLEKKYQDTIDTKNACRFMLSTNNDWVVPITDDERRYVIFEVSNAERKNIPYFISVYNQFKNGGAAKFLADMMERDIEDVDWTIQPKNNVYKHQKKYNYDVVQQYIDYSVERIREGVKHGYPAVQSEEMSFWKYNGRFTFRTVSFTTNEIYDDFCNFRDRFGNKSDKAYPIQMQEFIHKFKRHLDLPSFRIMRKIHNKVHYYDIPARMILFNWFKKRSS
jgi:hypothetical protein